MKKLLLLLLALGFSLFSCSTDSMVDEPEVVQTQGDVVTDTIVMSSGNLPNNKLGTYYDTNQNNNLPHIQGMVKLRLTKMGNYIHIDRIKGDVVLWSGDSMLFTEYHTRNISGQHIFSNYLLELRDYDGKRRSVFIQSNGYYISDYKFNFMTE